MQAPKTIGVRMRPETLKILAELQKKTGLTVAGVIKLAVNEMAERRLVPEEKKKPQRP